MAGPNRTPAQANGHVPPHWGTPDADPHSQPQAAQPQSIPSHEQLSRWSPPQHAYAPQHYAQPPNQQQMGQHPPAPQLHAQHAHAAQSPAPPGYPPAGYGYPTGHAAAAPNDPAYAQPLSAQPAQTHPGFGGYQPQADPYAQPAGQNPHPSHNAHHATAHPGFQPDAARTGYPNAYDRYAAAPPQDFAAQDFTAQSGDPHALSYPAEAARGYDQQPAQTAQQHPYGQQYAPQPAFAQPGPAEMQNWDLANYAPGQQAAAYQPPHGQPPQGQPHQYAAFEHTPQARADGYGAAPGNQFPGQPGLQHGQDPRYAQQAWPGQAQHAQSHPGHSQPQFGSALGEPPFDLDRYGQQAGNAPGYPAQPGYDQHGYPAGEQPPQDDYLEDAEPEPEPRRGPRALVVVAALVGAIVMGGGLVKGYQIIGGGKDNGKPPVVKADKSPTKTRPTDAGGKDIANNDKVFLNRLAEGGATAASATTPVMPPTGAGTPNDPEAPRKVQTVVVNKDGTITPQMQQAAPVQIANAAPASSLPGMVVDGFPRAATPTAPVTRQIPPASGAKVADLPLPKVKSDASRAVADAVPVTPPPPKKKVIVRDDLKATPAEASASGSNGYVAALTSKKSRDDALKTFANLHQTYPELQGKVPDVREVNLGAEKGTWYRLIVGPPSSRESAGDLCKKLKEQGLKDCWVTAY